MRCLLLACALAVWPAGLRADPGTSQPSRLWQSAAGSHEREVAQILSHARTLYENARRAVRNDRDEAVRERLLADARGMLRHARTLAADHPEVLELLAYVEEEAGQADRALALYERYLETQQKERISGRLCVRHGLLEARAGRSARALRSLRACLDVPVTLRSRSEYPHRLYALVHLANLHLDQGRVHEALDVLLPHTSAPSPDPLVVFALAVVYDKDEQRSRAYETLERLHLDDRDLVGNLVRKLGDIQLEPAADRHYFLALLYEAAGYLAEAREEWHNYSRSGDARFAGRAREHARDIAALLARGRGAGSP